MPWGLILSGNTGVLIFAVIVCWKVNSKLNREESLKQDFPPHRHINGSRIVYPKEYPPSPIERFGSD